MDDCWWVNEHQLKVSVPEQIEKCTLQQQINADKSIVKGEWLLVASVNSLSQGAILACYCLVTKWRMQKSIAAALEQAMFQRIERYATTSCFAAIHGPAPVDAFRIGLGLPLSRYVVTAIKHSTRLAWVQLGLLPGVAARPKDWPKLISATGQWKMMAYRCVVRA